MSFAKLLAENSALANAVDLIGDKWTLLILAGSYASICRFNELEKTLGINRNLLSSRLDRLVSAGVLEKRLYNKKPRRYEYIITEHGLELRPVLIGLAAWAEKYLVKGAPPISYKHDICGENIQFGLYCESCNTDINQAEVNPQLNESAGEESRKVLSEYSTRFVK